MGMKYWLRRFFKAQAFIDELEEKNRVEQSRTATFKKQMEQAEEGKASANQTIMHLQNRVNDYFAENECMRRFIVRKHGMKALNALAKEFMEAKKA